MTNQSDQKILKVFNGEVLTPPPIWIMRQAGRYLPEYKKERAKIKDFLKFCYTSELATKVSLQPINRFDFDAAILFSDIFIIPDALGYPVSFEENIGPKVPPLTHELFDLIDIQSADTKFSTIFDIVSNIRKILPAEKTLYGFCGAPWTLACYLISGTSTIDQVKARVGAYQDPKLVELLIEVLVESSVKYLIGQANAGANVLQIFDTWAGVLDEIGFEKWVLEPTQRIVQQVRSECPKIKIIGFLKNSSGRLKDYAIKTKLDGVGIDWTVPFKIIRDIQEQGIIVQGNLDPMKLVSGGNELDITIDKILKELNQAPFIFNLGHGIVPETPIENVHRLINRIRG